MLKLRINWCFSMQSMSMQKLYYYDKLYFVKPKDYNFYLTSAVYNFSLWFDGENLIIPMEDIVAKVKDLGEKIEVKIYTYPNISSDVIDSSVKWLNHVLGLNEDLTEFYSIASKDPLLSQALEYLRGMHFRASKPWIASVIGVCQQNASFKQGWKMFYNFVKLLGTKVIVEDREVYIYPSPSNIDESKVDLLRSTGLGYRVSTVLSLVNIFNKFKELNSWYVKPYELEEKLFEVKGVGKYTARLCLALSLRYYDKPPVDRWLKKIVSTVYGVPDKDVEAVYTRVWSRWSALAALYTTVVLDAEPLGKALDRIRRGLLKPNPNTFSPLTMWRYM